MRFLILSLRGRQYGRRGNPTCLGGRGRVCLFAYWVTVDRYGLSALAMTRVVWVRSLCHCEKDDRTTWQSIVSRGGEKVEFDSLKVDELSELKDICDDEKRPEWISNGARHACLSCYAKLHTVEKACNWGGNTPKVFHQNYDIGVTTLEAKKWFRIFPSD